MIFFTRFGYLVAVFFVIAAFIAGGAGTAFHLSQESASVLLFLFWGPPCIYYGRTLDHPGKLSYFFGFAWNIGVTGSSPSHCWTPISAGTDSRAIGSRLSSGLARSQFYTPNLKRVSAQ